MFSITEPTLVKIKKVTGVEEFKGDRRDYGCSVRIEFLTTNTVLDEFDAHLRKAFYAKDDGKRTAGEDGQEELALPRADVELTKRKCVGVHTPLKLTKEYDGYTITFLRGATESSWIKLGEVRLSDFAVDPHDGGSVLVAFSAYMKPPVEQRGYIDHMAQAEIEITLTPPEAKPADLVDKAQNRKSKKCADPFEGTDIPPLVEQDG